MANRKRRKFSDEVKADAVRLVRVGDKSVGQIAKDLDLTESALRNWVQRADVDDAKGDTGALTTSERDELQRLRRENKRLQMEREILKQAATRSTGHRNAFANVGRDAGALADDEDAAGALRPDREGRAAAGTESPTRCRTRATRRSRPTTTRAQRARLELDMQIEGWLHLVMIDLFARRVVGWATSTLNDRELLLDALESAIAARRPLAGLIQHSDRGSTYATMTTGARSSATSSSRA